MIPIALPMHVQAGQAGNVESSVTEPVRALSSRKYIRTSLDALEREAESFGNTPAGLVTG